MLYEWPCADRATPNKKRISPGLFGVLRQRLVDNIPPTQYFYEGCVVAFRDNKYFDLGHATNNTGTMVKLVLDPRDQAVPAVMEGHVRKLKYPPVCIVVLVHNGNSEYEAHKGLPKRCIPLFPTDISERFKCPKGVRLGKRKRHDARSSLLIYRYGYSFKFTHASSDYFVQGKTVKDKKVVLDLRLPPDTLGESIFIHHVVVMLTRVGEDNDWALLAPLWDDGNEIQKATIIARLQKALQFNQDYLAQMKQIKTKVEGESLQWIRKALEGVPMNATIRQRLQVFA